LGAWTGKTRGGGGTDRIGVKSQGQGSRVSRNVVTERKRCATDESKNIREEKKRVTAKGFKSKCSGKRLGGYRETDSGEKREYTKEGGRGKPDHRTRRGDGADEKRRIVCAGGGGK